MAKNAPNSASLFNTTAAFRGEQSTLVTVGFSGRLIAGVSAVSLRLWEAGFDAPSAPKKRGGDPRSRRRAPNEYEAAPGATRKLTFGACAPM